MHMERFQTLRINFNSIKVRLEHYVVYLPAASTVFQFHKGTIRTSEGEIFHHR